MSFLPTIYIMYILSMIKSTYGTVFSLNVSVCRVPLGSKLKGHWLRCIFSLSQFHFINWTTAVHISIITGSLLFLYRFKIYVPCFVSVLFSVVSVLFTSLSLEHIVSCNKHQSPVFSAWSLSWRHTSHTPNHTKFKVPFPTMRTQ